MARKGDRAHLEPQAIRLYADGRGLSDIAALLGVSVTSLSRWKEESRIPSAGMDEWDRARMQKRSNIQRLRDLFEDQLQFLEGVSAAERSAPMMDTLSKMGSLLERWDKIERTQQVVEAVFKEGERSREMTPEQLQEAIRKVYGV
ncbi:MAG: DUF1804 family protein [Desulfobulbus sp.]|nr:DUF1804 family protein [Desulfobulbus sp.]